jgi:hypothetical protein
MPCARSSRRISTTTSATTGAAIPDGLQGEDIPLAARIVAAADAYDAMVRGRPYAGTRPPTEAIGELMGEAGGQFDRPGWCRYWRGWRSEGIG